MPKKPVIPPGLINKLRALLTAQRDATAAPISASEPIATPAPALSGARPSPVDEAIDMIINHEKFRDKSYRDYGGRWTIGYGQATPDIGPGMRTTEPEARKFVEGRVREDSANFAKREVPISAGILSAAYNLGRGNLGKYGILSALRSGDYEQAAKILETATRTKGDVLPGLVKRRREEAANIRASQPTSMNAFLGLP